MLTPDLVNSSSVLGHTREGCNFLNICCCTWRKYWLDRFARSCCIRSLLATPFVLTELEVEEPCKSNRASPEARWATSVVRAADCWDMAATTDDASFAPISVDSIGFPMSTPGTTGTCSDTAFVLGGGPTNETAFCTTSAGGATNLHGCRSGRGGRLSMHTIYRLLLGSQQLNLS